MALGHLRADRQHPPRSRFGRREASFAAPSKLFNPNNPDVLVGANLLPAYNAAAPAGTAPGDWDESKPIPPVEVLRLVPPPQDTQEINVLAQAFLASKDSGASLLRTRNQWPKHPKAPGARRPGQRAGEHRQQDASSAFRSARTRTYGELARQIGSPAAVRARRRRERKKPDLHHRTMPPRHRVDRQAHGLRGRTRGQGDFAEA